MRGLVNEWKQSFMMKAIFYSEGSQSSPQGNGILGGR